MTTGQVEQRIDQIRMYLQVRETEELLEIWEANDREVWSPEAFEAIRRILAGRLRTVPPQRTRPVQPAAPAAPAADESLAEDAAIDLDETDDGEAGDESEAAPLMTDAQTEERLAQIRRVLQAHETENLLEIWKQNDREAWTPEAFEAIRRILRDRLGQVPRQLIRPAKIPSVPVAPVADDEVRLEQAEMRLDRADELVEDDEYEAALAECEAAVQLAPHWAEARHYRGMALESLGRLEEAIADYEASIRLDPKYYAARDSLSQAKLKLAETQPWPSPVEGADAEASEESESDEESFHAAEAPEEFDAEAAKEGAQMPPLYLDEKARIMRGWPGHRQRPGRSGYDPLETDFEAAHLEGVFLRNLITLRLRTRNPFYLMVMTVAGLVGLLPGLALPYVIYESGVLGCCLLPGLAPGVLLLGNVILSLMSGRNGAAD